VCAQFGNYVKFVVELPELKDPEPVLLPNAFAIMKASQRCLQLGDKGLPFPEVVKSARDRLYNDLLGIYMSAGMTH